MNPKITLSKSIIVSNEFRVEINKWLLDLFGFVPLTKQDNPKCYECYHYSKILKAELCLSKKITEQYIQNPTIRQKLGYWCPEGKHYENRR